MRKIFLAFVVAFGLAGLRAGEIAQKMAESAKGAKSLYAEFTQERTLSLLEEKSLSRGWFASDAGGRVRWQIDEPFRSAMVADSKGARHFEFADGKWRMLKSRQSFPVEKIVGEIRKLMTGEYSENAYSIEERGGKIILTPSASAARKFVSEIVVTPRADFSAPETVEIKNPNGDSSLIRLVKVLPNPKNVAEAFATEPLSEYSPK